MTSLRDRFFALSTGPRDEAAIATYRGEIDAIDPPPAAVIAGLGVMWHPTRTRKELRFVEASSIDESVRHLFACPSVQAPDLAAVFADPRELSFRSFDNIVPLDRLFDSPEVVFGARRKLADKVYAFPVEVSATTRAQLDRLDTLGLYVPPLNAGERGGERFIFHSAILAEALAQAIKLAMPKSLLGGFSHVNPVFRCNRFEPGDENFHRHRDAPYFDAARDHVSKYTVLLYLTGGHAEPALDVNVTKLDTIPAYTCVVFDQALEHEGAPFVDGRKVFLRTELVFVDRKISHDPAIAAQFSKACYWTGESVFVPELSAYAARYYNQVAHAHWHGLAGVETEPFVHKQYRDVHFVANGYDFWFDESIPLAEAAAITLLDYFNCTIDHTGFHELCSTTVVVKPDAEWIPAFLADKQKGSAIRAFDKAVMFPEPEEADGQCCPFHCELWDATRSAEVVELYSRAQTFAKRHIEPAPIMMLGQEVVIDPSKFVISSDRIDVLGKPLAPINFAACWNYGGSPDYYVDVEATVGVVQLLVPPILWANTRGCYHLRFDFFRNSWMVQHEQANVPVPKIRDLDEDMGDPDDLDGAEATPWVHAVDPKLISQRGGKPTQLWWAESSPLLEELFGDREDLED